MTEQHEIERRWLLREPPLERIKCFPSITIVQGYALCRPNELYVQKNTDGTCEIVLDIPSRNESDGTSLTKIVPSWVYDHYQNPKNVGKVRIREIDGYKRIATIKGDGTLTRPEWETELPESAARFLFERSESRVIHKTRTKVPQENHIFEFDFYGHRSDLDGLVLLECEFSNERLAHIFTLPSWVGPAREVTEDKRYTGSSLARYGIPFDPR